MTYIKITCKFRNITFINIISKIKKIFTKMNINSNTLLFTLFPMYKISKDRIVYLINYWNTNYNPNNISEIKPYFSQLKQYIIEYELSNYMYLFWHNIFINNIIK